MNLYHPDRLRAQELPEAQQLPDDVTWLRPSDYRQHRQQSLLLRAAQREARRKLRIELTILALLVVGGFLALWLISLFN